MILSAHINGQACRFDTGSPIDISIPLNFNGPQPNAYGVEDASSIPCRAGDLVGDTRLGGSVNFEQYTFIPHCNGTHTECIGHITHERISLQGCLRDTLIPAVLVSVEPEGNGDLLIGREAIVRSLDALSWPTDTRPSALVVRTLPNDGSKLTRQYNESSVPAYFSADAIQFIVESGFTHLLVDLPSIDRLFDDGRLSNHRVFWNVDPGSNETHMDSRIYNTITELIYVPSNVADGEYLLNLQIAPFMADASPSRPILFKSEAPA